MQGETTAQYEGALSSAITDATPPQRDALLETVFDSLAASVVALDRTGKITYASRAWLKFGMDGGARMSGIEVGANYLDVCRRAARDEPDALAALRGIEDVLAGRTAAATLEYACDTPQGRRWFLMQADPMPPEHGGAVVTHTDVTQRRAAEETLRQSEARYRTIVENQTDLICHYLPDTTLTFVNA